MKKLIQIYLLLVIVSNSIAQDSFEIRFYYPGFEIGLFSFEDKSGNFITIAGKAPSLGTPSNPLLIKYSNPQDTIFHLVQKQDTSVSIKLGFQKSNENYLFIGNLVFPVISKSGLYLWETTQDFETVWEKYYQLPEPYLGLEVLNYLIDSDSNIVISGRAYYPENGANYTHLYMGKVNINGDLLYYNIPAPLDRDQGMALLSKPDNSAYYLIGCSESGTFAREWVEFDLSLNIIGYGIMNWNNALGGRTSAKWLSDGNLLIATNHQNNLELRITDQDFNTINDTLIIEGGDYTPFYLYALDYTDESNIWVGTYDEDPYHYPGTTYYHVYIIDSQLNLQGAKYYWGRSRCWMAHLQATTDGGCIMTGMVPDFSGSWDVDIYVNKILSGDILSIAEETVCEYDNDVWIYPNPFDEYLNLETFRKGLLFKLYSPTCKEVVSKQLTSIPGTTIKTSFLQAGFYFYTISDKGRIIQNGKLIKQ